MLAALSLSLDPQIKKRKIIIKMKKKLDFVIAKACYGRMFNTLACLWI